MPDRADLLRRISEALADLYDDQLNARRLARSAGLDLAHLDLSGAPVVLWQNIAYAADRQAKVEALLALAVGEYPARANLKAVCEEYRQWQAAGRPEPLDDLADEDRDEIGGDAQTEYEQFEVRFVILEAQIQDLSQELKATRQTLDRAQQANQQLLELQTELVQRVAELTAAGKTRETAKFGTLLKRVGQLLLLVVGPTATFSALWEAFIADEIYGPLVEQLRAALRRTEDRVGPLDVTRPQPQPLPTPAQAGGTPTAPTLIRRGPLEFDWVNIPAGEFIMGSNQYDTSIYAGLSPDREKPQHPVYVAQFAIARVPVTVAQFRVFVQTTGYRTTAERQGYGWVWGGRDWKEVSGASWLHPSGPGSDVDGKASHPVTQVSWNDATAFCRWWNESTSQTMRLPSEAEWEKAARGTHGWLYPWGSQPPTARLANFAMNVGDTTPVGSYPAGASPYGVLDMAGNVWEWTNTRWGETEQPTYRYPYSASDGREDSQAFGLRVLRGGAFYDDARLVRCAARHGNYPVNADWHLGFRVVASPSHS